MLIPMSPIIPHVGVETQILDSFKVFAVYQIHLGILCIELGINASSRHHLAMKSDTSLKYYEFGFEGYSSGTSLLVVKEISSNVNSMICRNEMGRGLAQKPMIVGVSHDLRGDSWGSVPRSLFWREDLDGDGERGFDCLTFSLVSSKAHREGCRASCGGFPYWSFMLKGVDGELNFLPTEGVSEGQNSPSAKSVNNDAPDEQTLVGPSLPPRPEANRKLKILGKWKVASEFPSAKELRDATDCHWVVAHVTPLSWKQHLREIRKEQLCDIHDRAYMRKAVLDNLLNSRTRELISAHHKAKTSYDAIQARELDKDRAYAELERKCNEALQDLDKNLFVFDMRAEIKEIDSLNQDRAVVVSKVVPDAAMKLVRNDDLGVLITKLIRSSIIYGCCQAFEEVTAMKEPFVLEKMSGYRPSSEDEYDQAGDALVNALYPFLAEYVVNSYASLEQLLLKKPPSLRPILSRSCFEPLSLKASFIEAISLLSLRMSRSSGMAPNLRYSRIGVIRLSPSSLTMTRELIFTLHKASASCDTMRERELKKDKAYAELEKKCNEALQDLDKNPLISDIAVVVSKVIPDATMKLIHSDGIGVLIARLVKASIIYGRCSAFKEVAELKKPFVLKEMPSYHPSSKEEYD
nr:hypothetical protein [Tanacetum cinerariifolium]